MAAALEKRVRMLERQDGATCPRATRPSRRRARSGWTTFNGRFEGDPDLCASDGAGAPVPEVASAAYAGTKAKK